jgi:hypothetical protein
MKGKRWYCPFCSQASTRHWNLKVHINRRHNGIGEPIGTAGSFNSSFGSVHGQLEPAAAHSAKSNNFRNNPAHAYKTDYYPNSMSFSLTAKRNRESSSQNMDEMIRMMAELKEFLRWLPPASSSSQESMMNAWLFPLLIASSNPRKFQNNNVSKRKELPIGYRVQTCNTCIPGNRLDPICDSSIELEAVTKINHRCQPETLLSSINPQQQNTHDRQNTIRQMQVDLISFLVQVVNIRIATQQAMESGGGQIAEPDGCLRAQELHTPKQILQIMACKKLPDNRTWLKEEEYLDLGNIGDDNNNNKEQEKHWAYRLIKQEGAIKTLKINRNELLDFLNIAGSTFGAFQVQIDGNESRRYFIISIAFKC